MCLVWVRQTVSLHGAWADHKESVLSVKGKKVLHIDRNDHYGGFVSSLKIFDEVYSYLTVKRPL